MRAFLMCAVLVAGIKLGAIAFATLIGSIYSAPIGSSRAEMVLSWAVFALAVYLYLRRRGWASTVGFNGPDGWRDMRLAWLPFVYVLVPFINLFIRELEGTPDVRALAAAAGDGLVRGIAVALLEETTFRGLILAIMLHRLPATPGGVRRAVLASALLFGFWHLPVNPHWETNAAQIVYAAFAGVGFAAIVLRTRSIWLLMLPHALLIVSNFVVASLPYLASGEPTLGEIRMSAAFSVVLVLPLLLYGLYLLRDRETRVPDVSGAQPALAE